MPRNPSKSFAFLRDCCNKASPKPAADGVLWLIDRLKGNGAQGRSCTTDTRIFSPLLYQLSYLGTRAGGL